MVEQIPLHGRYAKGGHALVDAEDFARLSRYRWFARPDGYAARRGRDPGEPGTVYMHRQVLGVHAISADPREVDHIDHRKLNNRKRNLRLVTRGENEQNAPGARKDSSTGVRGVFPYHYGPGYVARVWRNGRGVHLGIYPTIGEADAAAQKARARLMTHAPESCRGAHGT